jgi:hypothetical protein
VVAEPTFELPRATRETVATLTPAARATSFNAIFDFPNRIPLQMLRASLSHLSHNHAVWGGAIWRDKNCMQIILNYQEYFHTTSVNFV